MVFAGLLFWAVAAAGCDPAGLTAEIEAPGGDVTLLEGESATFRGNAHDGASPYSFLWNFGGAAPDSTAAEPGDITFTSEGVYTVELRVTDSEGDTARTTRVVTVLPPEGRSQEDIRSYWNNIKPTQGSVSYATAPVFTVDDSGYEGVLDPLLVSEGIAWVNFYRWLAGLPDNVTEDEVYRVRCQKGSHVLTMLGINGDSVPNPHDPPVPSGSTSSYEATVYGGVANLTSNTGGWIACASGNVFRGWGGAPYTPVATVDGYMDDYGNDLTLGHRRWILYPRLGKTAFGAVGGGGHWASVMYVLERPGFTALEPTYDFVAYPSPGNYPLQCFTGSTALWSFSVNAALYDLDGSTWVTVVRLSDSLDLSVNTQMKTPGYGITPTLSFNPNEAVENETYSITVHDVWDKTLSQYFEHNYTVTFFDLNN